MADGSLPPNGEFITPDSGRPLKPRRGNEVATVVTDPTRSPEMDAHNAVARAALAAYNSGAAAQGAPVLGLDDDPGRG